MKRTELKRSSKPIARVQHRDQQGKYTFEGNWARLCVCGHPLGVHLAEAPHDCINGDPIEGATGEFCDCRKFRLSRKKANGTNP